MVNRVRPPASLLHGEVISDTQVVIHLVGNLEDKMMTSSRMLMTLIAKQRKTDSSLSWWIMLHTKQKRNSKLWTRTACNYKKLQTKCLFREISTSVPQLPRLDQEIRMRWEKKRSLSLILGISGHSSLISWYPISQLFVSPTLWKDCQLFSHHSMTRSGRHDYNDQTLQIIISWNCPMSVLVCFVASQLMITGLKWKLG